MRSLRHVTAARHPSKTGWHVGCARVDVTGEPWGAGMMGYGVPGQRTRGIMTRQFARALVFDDGNRRLAWVVADIGMFFQSAVEAVEHRLYRVTRGRFDARNVVLSATHTHCGPGGHSTHTLYNITTAGFHRRTFDRLVNGVVSAILLADADLEPAAVALGQGYLNEASVNRSPTAFDRNPDADRRPHPDRIDPLMTLLDVGSAGRRRAIINWFAVHGTSMSNRTTLINSDNKGRAARIWETGADETIVAAFAQSNAGDISPNLGGHQRCGPTADELDNTRIIAERQVNAARQVADTSPLPPHVDYRLMYVDLHRRHTTSGRTSAAILGASFAAGTSDGRGSPLFRQGKRNPVWQKISDIAYRIRPALTGSQAPKDLLIPVGALGWVQQRLPVQLIRLGTLYLVCLPMEVTITAGLRIRRSVAEIVDTDTTHVLVQGYSNGYAHYLTTEHEYDEQRYEAGSTMFGRHQLQAVLDVCRTLATSMAEGTPVSTGPPPRPRRLPATLPVRSQARRQRVAPIRWPRSAHAGQHIVAEFSADHPNFPIREQYLRVEHKRVAAWACVADDAGLSTSIRWRRERGRFYARLVWQIPEGASGEYRLGYVSAGGTVYTPAFVVTPAPR